MGRKPGDNGTENVHIVIEHTESEDFVLGVFASEEPAHQTRDYCMRKMGDAPHLYTVIDLPLRTVKMSTDAVRRASKHLREREERGTQR